MSKTSEEKREVALKPCPFCGGKAFFAVCDYEGNIHDEEGYESNPWSGLSFKIRHEVEKNEGCPIANFEEDGGTLGCYLYGTREDAAKAWNRRVNE